MKRHLLLALCVLPLIVSAQNQYINDINPVGRNIGFFLESGEVAWKTSFNLTQSGTNMVSDLTSVQLVGRVVWSPGVQRNQNFSSTLVPANDSPGLYESILKSDEASKSVVFKKAPAADAKWDQLNVTVSYVIKGVKYTLPEVVVFSPTFQDGASTKLDLVNRGTIVNDKTVLVFVNVIGSQSVRLTKAEIISDNGSTVKNLGRDYIGLGPFKVQLELNNAQPINYKVKISAETSTEALLTPIEKDVSFASQLKVTSIDGNADVSNGYRFPMLDQQSKKFQITTNGVGELTVSSSSKNHSLSLLNSGNGVYHLTISSSKLVFDDEDALEFIANGVTIPGNWTLYRENPEPTIVTSQSKNSGIELQILYPKWVTSNVGIQLPKRNSRFELLNTDAKEKDGSKVFSLSLVKSDFSLIDNAKDSVFSGKVIVYLASKSMLSQEFRFLNMDYYLAKITEAQKEDKKAERKSEIKKVLTSLFESTGSTPNETLIQNIVTNLSSKEEKEKKDGLNQVLGYAAKLAPFLIALI
jgi:hypothetical protein